MKNPKLKIGIRVILFLLLFIVMAAGLSKVYIPQDELNRQCIGGFYEEPKDKLDVVYIGSSNCLAYWNSMVGWQEYGITVYPYSGNSVPFHAAEYIIKEVRKTQPNAKFVVNLNTLPGGKIAPQSMHQILDCMPLSANRMALARHLGDMAEFTFHERLELYFPYTRYHVRWEEQLEPAELDGMKGAMHFDNYLKDSVDVTEQYQFTHGRRKLQPELYASTDSLLNYCREENLDIVFALVPQAGKQGEKMDRYNEMMHYLTDRGFRVLNMMEDGEKMGLDLTQDFYNENHTNIHGSIKFTHYMARKLIDIFDLPDRRDQAPYSDWNESLAKYRETVQGYVMPFEWDISSRDFSLPAPAKLHASIHNGRAMLTWKPVKGAEFYSVYRRLDGGWELLQTVRSRSFYDPQMEVGGRYQYRVVPCVTREGRTLYGNFQYDGPFVRAR